MPPTCLPDPCDSTRVTRAERSRRTAELVARSVAGSAETRREALDEVVVLNRGVAEAVAARYRGRGVADDDLVQVAYEGLVKAVRRFDPAASEDLLTFAVPTIRGEVLRHFRDLGWAVRPPRRVQDLQRALEQQGTALAQRLGREPSTVELAAACGATQQEVDEARAARGCFRPTSLDLPVGDGGAGGDGGATLGSLLPDDSDDGLAGAEARADLGPVVRTLDARDRRVLALRFVWGRSQREIGEELGVSQVQVSRQLSRILGTLRHDLGAA
ncbi:sigma-70 family RNA polymerase sigma factor [Nocardioides kribbensis]|uniref:sigma-70 family RNA polymerase sigma factor n=1 Tax=Nocardioides kribbensis TaxID=305517 RepID=UPI0032DA92EC